MCYAININNELLMLQINVENLRIKLINKL